jgi:hypothetical protein
MRSQKRLAPWQAGSLVRPLAPRPCPASNMFARPTAGTRLLLYHTTTLLHYYTSHRRYETPATVRSESSLTCRTPAAALVGCFSLLVSMDVCDFDALVQVSSCGVCRVWLGGLWAV